jgi:toxin ParE1/3/4
VPEYRLSRLALADLRSIARHTLQHWGLEQADRYLDDLGRVLNLLAASPALGRECSHIRKGYRRMEHGRHVIFYRAQPKNAGIDVIRILHDRMLPGSYLKSGAE